ncbi:MAG: protein kinase domain-containing protein [Vicinamibacterales bacterium]
MPIYELVGRQISSYKILSLLGAGGMGEVYRAHDLTLGREVAIKVLPPIFLSDPDRVARFEREARLLAALNHPHIGAIHGIVEADGVRALVLELVDGPTLAERLAHGAIPLDEVVSIARQVAAALGAAHRKGIIHRDLKPANIKITPEGVVKVLDFGLATVIADEGGTERLSASDAPTVSASAQHGGRLLGTAPYMSPEQARGQPVDKRTDIWAFGCVLYEALSRRRAFTGETISETIAKVLEREPDWQALPASTPPRMHDLLRRCLHKDPNRRLHDIADARIELDEALESPRVAGAGARTQVGTSTRWWLTRGAAAMMVVAVLGAAYRVMTGGENIDSVAVLPFVNVTADPDTEYLSDGITESVINTLSQLPQLRVMARNTVFSYKGREVDPRSAGRELQVDAVLTGKVVQQGDAVDIQAELVDVSRGSQLWGRRYRRSLSDILTLQEEIAKELSDTLRLRLTGEERERLSKRYTENTEAYQLYLKGRYYFDQRTGDGIRRSIELFQEAINRDPNYALAYAGLANAYLPSDIALPPRENIAKAKAAAMKALESDDSLAEAHVAYARVLQHGDWDWRGAGREFTRAIELNPTYSEARHMYSHYLMPIGRIQEAVAEARRALELDPLDVLVNIHLAWAYLYARQYDDSIEQGRKAIQMDPNLEVAHNILARAYLGKRMYRDAILEFQKAVSLAAGTAIGPNTWLGYAYAVSGNRGDAVKILDDLEQRHEGGRIAPFDLAMIYVGLGEHDRALDWLQRAFQERSGALLLLKVDSVFDGLRTDPRFRDLLVQVGLRP